MPYHLAQTCNPGISVPGHRLDALEKGGVGRRPATAAGPEWPTKAGHEPATQQWPMPSPQECGWPPFGPKHPMSHTGVAGGVHYLHGRWTSTPSCQRAAPVTLGASSASGAPITILWLPATLSRKRKLFSFNQEHKQMFFFCFFLLMHIHNIKTNLMLNYCILRKKKAAIDRNHSNQRKNICYEKNKLFHISWESNRG